MQGVGLRQQLGDYGMAGLMVGRQPSGPLIDYQVFALETHGYLILGVFEICLLDVLLSFSGGKQGRLIDKVGNFRPGESRGGAGDGGQVDSWADCGTCGVDFENL